MLLRVY